MYRRWHAFPRFVDNQFRIPLSVVLRVALFCMYHVITAMYVYPSPLLETTIIGPLRSVRHAYMLFVYDVDVFF